MMLRIWHEAAPSAVVGNFLTKEDCDGNKNKPL